MKWGHSIRRWYVRMLVRSGKAIDIKLSGRYPADVLCNVKGNHFVFDGVDCGSMEAFLQSLKKEDVEQQRQIAALKGRDARKAATTSWRATQTLYWKGHPMKRQSEEFIQLVSEAYEALYSQSARFRMGLHATKGKRLFHTHGKSDPTKTILTEREFCDILTKLRERHADDVLFGMGSRH